MSSNAHQAPEEPTDHLNDDPRASPATNDVEQRLQQSLMRDAIRDAVLAATETLEPDGRYDPADDPRPTLAVQQLAQLFEDPLVAEGLAAALRTLWMRWRLGEAAP